jgi:hypothetical protein
MYALLHLIKNRIYAHINDNHPKLVASSCRQKMEQNCSSNQIIQFTYRMMDRHDDGWMDGY